MWFHCTELNEPIYELTSCSVEKQLLKTGCVNQQFKKKNVHMQISIHKEQIIESELAQRRNHYLYLHLSINLLQDAGRPKQIQVQSVNQVMFKSQIKCSLVLAMPQRDMLKLPTYIITKAATPIFLTLTILTSGLRRNRTERKYRCLPPPGKSPEHCHLGFGQSHVCFTAVQQYLQECSWGWEEWKE